MAEIIPMIPDDGFKCTGPSGELPHGSTNAWGKSLFSGRKVHFWLRNNRGYESLCKSASAPAFLHNGQCPIFAPGNFPKCKKCMNLLRKGGSA